MSKNIKIKNIILASDHAGFKLKEQIKNFLIKKRRKVLDLGTNSTNSVDYPDFAHRLSNKMKKKYQAVWYIGLWFGYWNGYDCKPT